MPGKAEQAERIRDLKSQIAGVGVQEMPEILFQEISPGREPVTVYSAENGRPVAVPAYMLNSVMTKTLEDGRFMFVAKAEDAPEYKLGTIKCFLHPNSPMRGIVEAVGLGAINCRKESLASDHSGRVHAQHRHKQEWAAVQEHLEDKKEEKREARQDKQLKATLSIARGGQAATSDTEFLDKMSEKVWHDPEKVVRAVKGQCDICGKTGLKRVKAHKSMAHKEV